MVRVTSDISPEEFWTRVRGRFAHRYLEFREESALPKEGRRKRPIPPSVVGPWGGRLWQVGFLPPRAFYPDMQVGMTTAVRLVEPGRMLSEKIPWIYAGERPRVFSKSTFDFDRIIMRYRRREGNFKGTLTGDPGLDRHWGIYPWDEELAPIFREPEVRTLLASSAALSPDPKGLLPTLAVYGTEATFTLPISSSKERVDGIIPAFEGFGQVLDRLEAGRGLAPASRRPLVMDLLHDEDGAPFPVVRFDCPVCREPTHPRYQANLEIEVCEKCGKALYLWK